MATPLNPPQREAVNTLSGPLLVLAGAGTGKTRVVTCRIAELIRSGIAAERILAVTFTNKAAKEMKERASAILGKKQKSQPEISTFHSLCVRVLRRHIDRIGYPLQFAIYDRGDQEGLARAVLRAIQVPEKALRPGDLLYFISRWKSSAVRPDDAMGVAQTDKEHLAAAAYRRYQRDLKTAGAVDFDDLLLLTEELFRKFADVRRTEAGRFDHLLIDEYQDTNGSQYRIVKALAAGHRNLCVVGDDDQSIYGWRGAEVTHILNFKKDWPEAKVIRLEDNYRSTDEILQLANRLIAFNSQRHDKVLIAARSGGEKPRILQFQDEEIEAQQVVAEIALRLEQPEVQPRDFAILFRTNQQPRAFEMELRKARLPYVLIGGMSFYDRKEVRDILAYIKLMAFPKDEISLRRIINKPPRGIGQASVGQLIERAVQQSCSLWEVLSEASDIEGINSTATQAITKFQELIERYHRRTEEGSLVEAVTDLIHEIGYREDLARVYPEQEDQDARWETIEEIINALGRYESRNKKATLHGFLDDVALAERDENDDGDSGAARNAITLMTLHSAKGLEFPEVFLVGMEEGILPHHRSITSGDAAIDEERRLCYVGVTRAQDRLTLTLPLTRMKWGKSRDTQASRFLFELAGQADNPRAKARQKPAGRQASKSSG